MYRTYDHSQGLAFELNGSIAGAPAAHAILVAHGAHYQHGTIWTISPKGGSDLTTALDRWIAGGCPESGLQEGPNGVVSIQHWAKGYAVKNTPANLTPAMKRIGAVWNSANSAWIVPPASASKLEALVAKANADGKKASEETWPTIDGVKISVRADGVIAVTSPYAPEIRNAIAAVPTARWDNDDRVWTVMARYGAALRKALISIASHAAAATDVNKARLARAAGMRKISWAEAGSTVTVRAPYDEEVNNACRNAGLRWNPISKTFVGVVHHDVRDRLLDELIDRDVRLAQPAAVHQSEFTSSAPSDPHFLALANQHSAGEIVQRNTGDVVVTKVGPIYTADEDVGSLWGKPEWQDRRVQLAYYRPAIEGGEMWGLE